MAQKIIVNLKHMFNISSYLKSHPNLKLVKNTAPMDLGSNFASVFQGVPYRISFMEMLRSN